MSTSISAGIDYSITGYRILINVITMAITHYIAYCPNDEKSCHDSRRGSSAGLTPLNSLMV